MTTNIFQRVLFKPKEWYMGTPLSSIQHPLEDPGMKIYDLLPPKTMGEFFQLYYLEDGGSSHEGRI